LDYCRGDGTGEMKG